MVLKFWSFHKFKAVEKAWKNFFWVIFKILVWKIKAKAVSFSVVYYFTYKFSWNLLTPVLLNISNL